MKNQTNVALGLCALLLDDPALVARVEHQGGVRGGARG